MTATYSVAAVIDACAKVIAGAIAGNVFAAGVTTDVTTSTPTVVPIADDFSEAGLPAVLCTLGDWHPALQPGNERYGASNPLVIHCAVWRPRFPLAENVAALLDDRDAIIDAFIAHTKAGLVVPELQAVVMGGGPGLVPQQLASADPQRPRAFLTLPFTLNVTLNRTVIVQPDRVKAAFVTPATATAEQIVTSLQGIGLIRELLAVTATPEQVVYACQAERMLAGMTAATATGEAIVLALIAAGIMEAS